MFCEIRRRPLQSLLCVQELPKPPRKTSKKTICNVEACNKIERQCLWNVRGIFSSESYTEKGETMDISTHIENMKQAVEAYRVMRRRGSTFS